MHSTDLPIEAPPLLIELIEARMWRHPGDEVLRRVAPLLVDPVDFVKTVPSSTVAAYLAGISGTHDWEAFRIYFDAEERRPLPWLDGERAMFIAINRIPGDDVAIALDFRPDARSPRVVGSRWGENLAEWFEIASSFDEFVRVLGLRAD